MKEIKKVDVLSLAKVVGLIYAMFGLLAALLLTIAGGMSGMMGVALPTSYGIILIPVFYGISGFIAGAFGGMVYNFVAKKIGGIKINI